MSIIIPKSNKNVYRNDEGIFRKYHESKANILGEINMTRKEFLTNMIRSILGYSIIDLKIYSEEDASLEALLQNKVHCPCGT